MSLLFIISSTVSMLGCFPVLQHSVLAYKRLQCGSIAWWW